MCKYEWTEYCREISERILSVYSKLRERYAVIRVNELTAKMQKSQATSEEVLELVRLKNWHKHLRKQLYYDLDRVSNIIQ